jgi:hypothetical protein
MPTVERQAFFMALAELVRRHHGTSDLPPGPDLIRYELGVYSQNGEETACC